MSQHGYAACCVGSEAALKQEVTSRLRHARAGFARPGLVTFRLEDDRLPDDLMLAHRTGLSHGMVEATPAAIAAVLHALGRSPAATTLCCWTRAGLEGQDEGLAGLEALAAELGCPAGRPAIDVVLVDPGKVLLGTWTGSKREPPWPGGRFPAPPDLTTTAPSRAYVKLREVMAAMDVTPGPGTWAVDLGAAPGGSTLALLEAGLNVVAVDSAPLDPRVSAEAAGRRLELVHLARPLQEVARRDLPRAVNIMTLDINAPGEALVERMEGLLGAGELPRVLIWTVKLRNVAHATRVVPLLAASLRRLGFRRGVCRQLSHHHREVALVAWATSTSTSQ